MGLHERPILGVGCAASPTPHLEGPDSFEGHNTVARTVESGRFDNNRKIPLSPRVNTALAHVKVWPAPAGCTSPIFTTHV